MRILCINANYPGRLGLLAGYLAEQGHEVLFAACHSRKGFSLPHVRRVLLKSGEQKGATAQDPCVRQWQQILGVASAAIAPLRLINNEFQPHMVLSTPAEGASFFAGTLFPQAFHGFYAVLSRGLQGATLQTQVLVQSLHILQSHAAFVFSEAEKRFLSPRLWPLLEDVDPWLDTDLMDPALAESFAPPGCGPNDEWVCFRVQELHAAHQSLFSRLVLELLRLRPHCHVLLDCAGEGRDIAWSTRLPVALRARIHMRGRQNFASRRDMLRNAFVYVVPGPASETALARLEAMGCGALLMASLAEDKTAPPHGASQDASRLTAACDREGEAHCGLTAPCPPPQRHAFDAGLERPGRNMLPFPAANLKKQVWAIIDALDRQHEYAALRRKARESICERFSPQELIPRHVTRLLECYTRFAERA